MEGVETQTVSLRAESLVTTQTNSLRYEEAVISKAVGHAQHYLQVMA